MAVNLEMQVNLTGADDTQNSFDAITKRMQENEKQTKRLRDQYGRFMSDPAMKNGIKSTQESMSVLTKTLISLGAAFVYLDSKLGITNAFFIAAERSRVFEFAIVDLIIASKKAAIEFNLGEKIVASMEKTKDVFSDISDKVFAMSISIKQSFYRIPDYARESFQSIKSIDIKEVFSSIKKGFDSFFSSIKGIDLSEIFSNLKEEIPRVFNSAMSNVGDIFSNIYPQIKRFGMFLTSSLVNSIRGIGSGISSIISENTINAWRIFKVTFLANIVQDDILSIAFVHIFDILKVSMSRISKVISKSIIDIVGNYSSQVTNAMATANAAAESAPRGRIFTATRASRSTAIPDVDLSNLGFSRNSFEILKQDATAIKGIVSEMFKGGTGSLLEFVHTTELAHVGLLGIGTILTQTDSKIMRTIGVISILGAIFAGGVVYAIQSALGFVGDAFQKLGDKMSEVMSTWVDKFQKAQNAVANFEFTINSMNKAFGKSIAGSLDDWRDFITLMEKTTVWDNTSLSKMVQEIVAVGSTLQMTNAQQRMFGKLIVEHAKAGEDLFDVSVAFVQALNGMGQGVIKYGLHVSDTAINHTNFAKTLGKTADQMNDYEKAQARLASLLEQSIKIEGKAALQLNTMVGVNQQYEKAVNRLGIQMGQQGAVTMLYYRTIGAIIDTVSRVPEGLMNVIGTLWDLVSVIFKVGGAWLSHAIFISGIVSLYKLLSTVVASSIIVQKVLTAGFAMLSTAINANTGAATVNAVAVTSLSAVWQNLAMVLRGVLMITLVTIKTMLIESAARFLAFSKMIIMSPLTWKILAIAAAVYLVYKAFQQLENKTHLFSTLWTKLSEASERLVGALFKTEDSLSKTDKAMMFFNATVASLVDIVEILVSGGLTQLLLFLNMGITTIRTIVESFNMLAKAIGITINPLEDIIKTLKDYENAAQDALVTASKNATDALRDLWNGVDRSGNAYGDARVDAEGFKDTLDDMTTSLKGNSAALKESLQRIKELEEAQAKLQASGDSLTASILKSQAAQEKLNAEGLKPRGKVTSDEETKKAAENMEELKKQAGIAKIEAEKAVSEVEGKAVEMTIDVQIKAKIDKKDFAGALQLELENSKEIADVQQKINNLQIYRDTSPDAARAIEGLQKQQQNIEANLRQKYKDLEQQFNDEKVQAASEVQDKILEKTDDTYGQLQKKRDEDLADLQKKLKEGLISVEQARKAEKAINDAYASESIKGSQQESIDKLETEKAAEAAKVQPDTKKIAELENQIKQLQIPLEQTSEANKDSMAQAATMNRDISLARNEIDAIIKEALLMARGAAPDVADKVDLDTTPILEWAEAYVQSINKVEGAEQKMTDAVKKWGDNLAKLDQRAQENFKDIVESGGIDKAKEMMKQFEDFKKALEQIRPQVEDGLKKIIEASAVSMEKTTSPDAFKNIAKKNIEELKKYSKEWNDEVAQAMAENKKRMEKEFVSVFDKIDFGSVDGLTLAFGDLLDNFKKINPGQMFAHIIAKAFTGPYLKEAGMMMREKGQAELARAMKDMKLGGMIAGVGKAVWGTLIQSLSQLNVWATIIQFFGGNKQEFRKMMTEKIEEFAMVFENMADNIPTFFVSIMHKLPYIISNLITGIIKLSMNMVFAMVPVMVASFVTEMTKTLLKLPEMMGRSVSQAWYNVVQGMAEIRGAFVIEAGKTTYMYASIAANMFNSIYSVLNAQLKDRGMVAATEISYGLSHTLVASVGAMEEAGIKNANVYGGILQTLSGATFAVMYGIRKSWQNMTVGIFEFMSGISTAFANQSEQAAEWAWGMIAITTIVKATIAALNGEFLKAGSILVAGIMEASALLKTYGGDAWARMKKDAEDAQKSSAKWKAEMSPQEKAEALKGAIQTTKRMGSEEFKVKDVQDIKTEQAIKTYALETLAALKEANNENPIPDELMEAQKGEQMIMANLEQLRKIMGDTSMSLVIAAATLGAALLPILPVTATIIIIVAAVAGLVLLIIKYWDAIKRVLDRIADWTRNLIYGLGDWLAKLPGVILQMALDLWNYIASGTLAQDLYNGVLAALALIDTYVVQPIRSTFQWIYDTFIAPVVLFIEQTLGPIFSGFLAGFNAMFTDFDLKILQPLSNMFNSFLTSFDQQVISPLAEKATTIAMSIGDGFASVWNSVKKDFENAWKELKKFATEVANIFKGIGSIGKTIADAIFKPFIWFNDSVIQPVLNAIKGVTGAGDKAGNWLSKAANKVGDTVASAFNSIFAHGGIVKGYAQGGVIWRAANGMRVPGLAGGGNNYARDIVPAMLSPGEIVLPNTITRDGNLMSDLADLLSGRESPKASFASVSSQQSITNEYNISINITGNSKMSKQDVEREILPVLIEGLKDATTRGKQIINQKGVYK